MTLPAVDLADARLWLDQYEEEAQAVVFDPPYAFGTLHPGKLELPPNVFGDHRREGVSV